MLKSSGFEQLVIPSAFTASIDTGLLQNESTCAADGEQTCTHANNQNSKQKQLLRGNLTKLNSLCHSWLF